MVLFILVLIFSLLIVVQFLFSYSMENSDPELTSLECGYEGMNYNVTVSATFFISCIICFIWCWIGFSHPRVIILY